MDDPTSRDVAGRSKAALLEAWRALVVLFAAAIAVLLPLELVLDVGSGVRLVFLLAAWVFFLDVPLSIYRALRVEQPWPGSSPALTSYFKRWFALDIAAAVPWGLLTGIPALALIRLVKLAKVRSILARWRHFELRYADALLLAFTVSWMALATHWIACGWIYLRGAAPGAPPVDVYVNALYWTTTTLTTVGYGDLVPHGTVQQLYAIGTMVLGIGFFGYLIGTIAGLWARHDPARRRFREDLERLATAAKYARLPRSLQHRIHEYHSYVWKQRLGHSEQEFLRGLPPKLRAEVSLHMKRSLLEQVDLFRGADPEAVKEVALNLQRLVLTPGDVVFREGEEGREMYFIARGELEVLSRDMTRIAVMGPGSFFGEIALLTRASRSATLRALTYCDVYSLSAEAFEGVAARYPDMLETILETARSRSAADVVS